MEKQASGQLCQTLYQLKLIIQLSIIFVAWHSFNLILILSLYRFLSGASLAQDRGRLEARIEALNAEVVSLKKQSERENDTLKIKTKMVDDQTDTIRKLKEVIFFFSAQRPGDAFTNIHCIMHIL